MSGPAPTDIDPNRGKAARNERRKAFATTLNALSVTALITASVQPFVAGTGRPWWALGGAFVFVAFQLALHYVLERVED